MPVQFSTDRAARLVTYRAGGTLTAKQFREFLDRLTSDPDFDRGFGVVGEHHPLAPDATPADVEGLVRVIRECAEPLTPCRWAFVVPSEESYGPARMLALMVRSAGFVAAPFSDFDRARLWVADRLSTVTPSTLRPESQCVLPSRVGIDPRGRAIE